MRRNFYILFGVLCLVSIGMLGAGLVYSFRGGSIGSSESGNEIIRLRPSEMNFGEVLRGKPITCEFQITNVSDQIVTLQGETCCGGPSIRFDQSKLAPKTSTVIHVEQNNIVSNGPFASKMTIFAVEHPKSKISANLKGRVVSVLEVVPSYVSFGKVRNRRGAFQDVELRTLTGSSIQVREILTTKGDVVVKQIHRTDKNINLRITLSETLMSGPFEDFIKVSFTSPQELTETIPISGVYTGELMASSSRLFTDKLTDDNWREIALETTIEQVDGSPFKIKRIYFDDPHFKVTVHQEGAAATFKLDVKLDQPVNGAFVKTIMTVEGDLMKTSSSLIGDPNEDAVLKIPVFFARSLL